jgi:hypothetical protein
MSLKTATLIAIIGAAIHLAISLSSMIMQFGIARSAFPIHLYRLLWIVDSVAFGGCLILFLAVFYSKQKE